METCDIHNEQRGRTPPPYPTKSQYHHESTGIGKY